MILEDEREDKVNKIMHEKRIESLNWLFLKSSLISNDITRKNVEKESYWFTLRHSFKPEIKRVSNDEKETEQFIDETEVAIAFKFTSVSSENDGNQVLELDLSEGLLPVYSFLPTAVRGKCDIYILLSSSTYFIFKIFNKMHYI